MGAPPRLHARGGAPTLTLAGFGFGFGFGLGLGWGLPLACMRESPPCLYTHEICCLKSRWNSSATWVGLGLGLGVGLGLGLGLG